MRYVSTRGQAPMLDFEGVTLTGLASDGGLYLPESWPQFSADEIRAMRGLSYPQLAARVMAPFVDGSLSPDDLLTLCEKAYGAFDHAATTPLVQLDGQHWLLELFHGPTLAFKDVALQLLGLLFERFLESAERPLTIIGATSGDTGSAAIHAVAGRDNAQIFMLHPEGRVSEIQRRQMTTISAANVHNIAIGGSFDDAQAMVKRMFADPALTDTLDIGAVNSINWARLMPQIVYYFKAALELGAPDRKVAFSVPTGNFGNVFAGYVAMQMGLPVERLIIASNRNDILTRFFENGAMQRETVTPSLSPSMDIQVSSNFERLLFELLGRNGARVAEIMARFSDTGQFDLQAEAMKAAHEEFAAYSLNDEGTVAEIAASAEDGIVLDPHSAVGVSAARRAVADGTVPAGVPVVALACAHPAKFDSAVTQATGTPPALPPHLADLMDRPEKMHHADATADAVRHLVLARRRDA